ncbi:MAG TPA: AAA family ATPase [Terracidiphilus sp.]
MAGAGKTAVLSVIHEGAEVDGYRVEGFAPTSRRGAEACRDGMETSTLQKHLTRGEQSDIGVSRLYVLDESSHRLDNCMNSCTGSNRPLRVQTVAPERSASHRNALCCTEHQDHSDRAGGEARIIRTSAFRRLQPDRRGLYVDRKRRDRMNGKP